MIVILYSYITKAGDSNMSPITSTRSLSLGGHYYAGSDNVTSSFINPAKVLCSPGIGIDINLNSIAGQNSLSKSNGDLHRSFLFNDVVGSGGIYWTKKRFGFGLVYNNQALHYSVRWPLAMLFEVNNVDRVFGYQLTSRLLADAISPVVGFKFGRLSLGISANCYVINRQLAFPIGNRNYITNGEDPAYQIRISQKGKALGWNIGFVNMVSNQLRFGGSLHSGISADLTGKAFSEIFFDIDSTTNKSKVSSRIELPIIGGLGVLYKVKNHLSLNLDATVSLWNQVQSSCEYTYLDTAWVSRLPESNQDSITGYFWKDQPWEFRSNIDIGFGVEYKTDSNMFYRFGYRFTQTPNSERTYTLLFPEVNRHWLSFGIGYQQGGYIFDLGVVYSIGTEMSIPEDRNQNVPGKYGSRTIILSLNVRYVFK